MQIITATPQIIVINTVVRTKPRFRSFALIVATLRVLRRRYKPQRALCQAKKQNEGVMCRDSGFGVSCGAGGGEKFGKI
jgi:hypothetical protein